MLNNDTNRRAAIAACEAGGEQDRLADCYLGENTNTSIQIRQPKHQLTELI